MSIYCSTPAQCALEAPGLAAGQEPQIQVPRLIFEEKIQGKKPVKPYKLLWHVLTMLHCTSTLKTERY